MESTSVSWAIAELVAGHAGRVTISNPMQTKAIASAKVKTDKIDAKVLAKLGAADFLPEVWVPDEQTRALRRRLSHRAGLVGQRTRLRNQIHAVLARNLVELPASDLFGRRGRRLLEELELPAHEREQVGSALRLHDALDHELEECERPLGEQALASAQVRRLMTIPGVGPVTALSLLAVVGEGSRFPSARHVVGYLGLDPRVRQSGERPARTGRISRQGNSHARHVLIEAAHSAIRTAGPLRAFYWGFSEGLTGNWLLVANLGCISTLEVVMRPPEVFVRPLSHEEALRLKQLVKRSKHASTRERASMCWAPTRATRPWRLRRAG